MHRCLAIVALLVAVSDAAIAQDLEREARWRAEVVPAIVVGEAVDIPGGSRPFLGLLTETNSDRARTTLLVIVHGLGVHPDHGIVGRLRMDLADEGFATLSIQMPVAASDAAPDLYPPLFADASERIARAAEWAQSKGYRDLVLVSHSMGSRMANAYFDRVGKPHFRAWVALGLGVPYSAMFSKAPRVPVLDVLGERDLDPVAATAAARAAVARASGARQARVDGADHFYDGREAELVRLIADFSRAK